MLLLYQMQKQWNKTPLESVEKGPIGAEKVAEKVHEAAISSEVRLEWVGETEGWDRRLSLAPGHVQSLVELTVAKCHFNAYQCYDIVGPAQDHYWAAWRDTEPSFDPRA